MKTYIYISLTFLLLCISPYHIKGETLYHLIDDQVCSDIIVKEWNVTESYAKKHGSYIKEIADEKHRVKKLLFFYFNKHQRPTIDSPTTIEYYYPDTNTIIIHDKASISDIYNFKDIDILYYTKYVIHLDSTHSCKTMDISTIFDSTLYSEYKRIENRQEKEPLLFANQNSELSLNFETAQTITSIPYYQFSLLKNDDNIFKQQALPIKIHNKFFKNKNSFIFFIKNNNTTINGVFSEETPGTYKKYCIISDSIQNGFDIHKIENLNNLHLSNTKNYDYNESNCYNDISLYLNMLFNGTAKRFYNSEYNNLNSFINNTEIQLYFINDANLIIEQYNIKNNMIPDNTPIDILLYLLHQIQQSSQTNI